MASLCIHKGLHFRQTLFREFTNEIETKTHLRLLQYCKKTLFTLDLLLHVNEIWTWNEEYFLAKIKSAKNYPSRKILLLHYTHENTKNIQKYCRISILDFYEFWKWLCLLLDKISNQREEVSANVLILVWPRDHDVLREPFLQVLLHFDHHGTWYWNFSVLHKVIQWKISKGSQLRNCEWNKNDNFFPSFLTIWTRSDKLGCAAKWKKYACLKKLDFSSRANWIEVKFIQVSWYLRSAMHQKVLLKFYRYIFFNFKISNLSNLNEACTFIEFKRYLKWDPVIGIWQIAFNKVENQGPGLSQATLWLVLDGRRESNGILWQVKILEKVKKNVS